MSNFTLIKEKVQAQIKYNWWVRLLLRPEFRRHFLLLTNIISSGRQKQMTVEFSNLNSMYNSGRKISQIVNFYLLLISYSLSDIEKKEGSNWWNICRHTKKMHSANILSSLLDFSIFHFFVRDAWLDSAWTKCDKSWWTGHIVWASRPHYLHNE